MSGAMYVGRVGALAIALGIGAVIAGMPGVAWAGPEGESDPSGSLGTSQSPAGDGNNSVGDTPDNGLEGETDPGDSGDSGDQGDPGDPGKGGAGDSTGGMKVDSSGGALTSTKPGSAGAKSNAKDRDSDPPKRSTVKPKVASLAPSPMTTKLRSAATTVADAGRRARSQAPALSIASQKDPGPQVKQQAGSSADATPPARTTASSQQQAVTTTMTAVTKPLAQPSVSRILSFVTLAPTADGKQPASTESPLLSVFLAGGRQADRKATVEDESVARTVDSAQAGLMTTTKTSSLSLRSLFTRDITKPVVSLSAPGGGGPVSGTVTLSATASDNVGVTDVRFYVDNSTTALATDTTSPYSASWNTTTVTNGAHTVKAVARDAAGNTTTSTRTVTVDNAKPVVGLSAPGGGGPVSGTVTLSATASDNVGVTQVQFFVDNSATALATDATSPYSASWNTTTVSNGAHTLSAVARDAAGNTTLSAPVVVTVANPDVTAPTVAVAAPTGPVSGVASLSASAADNVGVAGVQFFINGTAVGGEDTTSPYSTSWNTATVANGSYTVTARARDAAGNITTSAPVTITVVNSSPSALSGTTTSVNVGSNPNGIAVVGNRAYVANGASNTVSVIDANTQQIVATIPVDNTPTYVVGAPDGTRVYVSNANSATVSVIDTSTNRVIKSIGVYGGAYAQIPGGLAISPEGKNLYVSTYDGTISLIDTTTNAWKGLWFIRPGITNMEVSPDGKRLYIADTQRGVILAVDTAKLTGPTSGIPDIPEFGVGYGATPVDVAVSHDGKWLYTVNTVDATHNSVSVIDADPTSPTYTKVVRTINVGDTAAFVTLSPDDTRAYVTHQVPGKVTVIDTKLNLVLGTVPTDDGTVASRSFISVGPDGRLFITDSSDNRILIMTVSGGVLPTVPVSVTPISVGNDPTGIAVANGQMYVYGNGIVSVIDTATKAVTGTTAVYTDPATATSPDGTRRYAVNGRSVSVIDTATNTVIASVAIPTCDDCYYWPGGLYGVEVSPDGSRVYVRENYVTETGGTTVVSVIDTTTNTLIGTGYPPLLNDIDATPDGRLYAADMTIPAIYVYDRNMNGIASIISLPGTWYAFVDALAVNADGTRTFAVIKSWDVGFQHVSVIDSDPNSPTYNTELARIRQQDTVRSLDGTRTYVLGSDGRSVAVLDNATNTVVGTFATDLSPGPTTRSIAIGPDGTLYITDSADNKVYAVTIGPESQQL